jgi:beta-lactamase class A
MRSRFSLASIALLAASPVFAQAPASKAATAVPPIAQRCQGTVSLYAKNLDTGETFGIREDERVRTASTIKLPIMVGVFQAVAEGKAKFTDTIELTQDDKVSGSGVLREFSNGLKVPIKDLVHLMIVVSDNTATNLLLDRFSADYVNAYISKIGMEKTRSLRKILGDGRNLKPNPSGHSKEGKLEEFRRFGIGVATPREMVMLLEKLEKGEVVSAEASKEMIAILRRQQDDGGMQRRLSDPVASKSGALDRLRSDVGIVYTKSGGRIAMALTVDDLPQGSGYKPENPGLLCLADLSVALVGSLSKPAAESKPATSGN